MRETRITSVYPTLFGVSTLFGVESRINELIDDLEHGGREITEIKILGNWFFGYKIFIVSTIDKPRLNHK